MTEIICYSDTIDIIPGDGHEWFTVESDTTYRPFLFIEGNLGVPQKALFQSYLLAISFYRSLRRVPTLSHSGAGIHGLLLSSCIILLANPALRTALNTRKRLVQDGHLEPHHELKVIESLLSVRLCTKESMLWHHRQWLLRRIHSTVNADLISTTEIEQNDQAFVIPPDAVRKELALVSRACELYPRNYAAWTHRVFCLRTLDALTHLELLIEEHDAVRGWIDRHVSDYSAVQYLCNLSDLIQSVRQDDEDRPADGDKLALMHAMSLVRSFPSHESLWLYLRAAVTSTPSRKNNLDILQECESFAESFLAQRDISDGRNYSDSDCDLVAWNARRWKSWYGRTVRRYHYFLEIYFRQ